jgi:hypothetical protein
MKRTTIYLAPDLEVRLKTEMVRRGQPMAEIVREAVEQYLAGGPAQGPPGAGAFASGHDDTADRAEALLGEFGFGGPGTVGEGNPYPKPQRRRAKRRA